MNTNGPIGATNMKHAPKMMKHFHSSDARFCGSTEQLREFTFDPNEVDCQSCMDRDTFVIATNKLDYSEAPHGTFVSDDKGTVCCNWCGRPVDAEKQRDELLAALELVSINAPVLESEIAALSPGAAAAAAYADAAAYAAARSNEYIAQADKLEELLRTA